MQVALGLGGIGEVVLRDGDVVGEESAHRVRVRLEEPVAEPDIEQLVVVADRLDRGEQLAQPASGDLCRIERLDEGPGADLAGAHRVAHPGEAHGKDLGISVGNDAGVEQSGARPEIGGGLDAHHAYGAASEVFGRADRPVVLHHVSGAEPLLARGLEADAGHDLHVDALRAGEDHGEARGGAAVELARQVSLEALGIRLEQDLLELVFLALVRSQVRPRAHQPDLLLGGETAAEADQRWLGGVGDGIEKAEDREEREGELHEASLLDVVGF